MSKPPPALPLGNTAPAVGLPTLESIRVRESLESEVEACARDLAELVPRMRLRRAVFAGEWVLGVHVGGLEDADLAFSRLDIRMHIDVPGQRVRLTRCITVRNRDEESVVFEASLDKVGRRRLTGFIESAFLGFTRLYFETR
jgi:hypothetical protein